METGPALPRRAEVWWALGYFAAYMAYNASVGGESEAWHWLALVALPVAGLFALQRTARPEHRLADTLASIGLRRGNLKKGVGVAIGLGLAISLLQTMGRFEETWALVVSGRAFILYPAVILLLFLTAGFTEEVFFRGVLQTRLASATGSDSTAILVTSIAFSIYHIPYTYLVWPNTVGDPWAATQAAFVNGMLGGVVLGVLYARTRNNLVATITLHTLINSIPAMTMIRFGGG